MDTSRVIKLLNDLHNQAVQDKSQVYRIKAFQKALDSVKKWGKPTLTLQEAATLEGVGKGILTRLKEFQETSALDELKSFDTNKQDILDLFQGIYGVGPVKAQQLYEKGYTTLKSIPDDELTKAQQVGKLYYNEINSKIPRSEIDAINEILQQFVSVFNKTNNCECKAQICGSYLRGKSSSGDIDIIISEKNDRIEELIDTFIRSCTFVSHILARGKTKILTLGGLKTQTRKRIDFELVKWNDWYYALLYFTGTKKFNQYMRGVAKQQNYLLNHSGLYMVSKDDGSLYGKICVNSEKEIFELLSMKYLTPKERETYN